MVKHDKRWPDGTPKLTPQLCPECGAVQDSASGIDNDQHLPGPDDASVCLYCGTISIFEIDSSGDLRLRKATTDETIWWLDNSEDCRRALLAWAALDISERLAGRGPLRRLANKKGGHA